jgi:hypothetical protein
MRISATPRPVKILGRPATLALDMVYRTGDGLYSIDVLAISAEEEPLAVEVA